MVFNGIPTPGSSDGIEPTESKREREINANIKLWKRLGVKVNREEIRSMIEALPEVEGFDWCFFVPKGVKISQLLEKQEEIFPKIHDTDDCDISYGTLEHSIRIYLPDLQEEQFIDEVDLDNNIVMTRTSEQSYAIAARNSQEPDDETIGDNARSVLKWQPEEDSGKYMTFLERIIAGIRWQIENKSFLDEKNWTMLLGSQHKDGEIDEDEDGYDDDDDDEEEEGNASGLGLTPTLENSYVYKQRMEMKHIKEWDTIMISGYDDRPNNVNPIAGPRKVITAETSTTAE